MKELEADGHTNLRDAVFCAFDCETTGINPAIDRILEVGIIRFTLEEVLTSYSSLVNPMREIPEYSTTIHGITDEMVKDAPAVGDILGAVADFIGDSPLVIQNPRFDLSFLGVAFRQGQRPLPPFHAYDTVRLSRSTFTGLPNFRLATLCASLNIAPPGHRALSDAHGCMEVFRKVVKYHDRDGAWNFNDLNRLHGNTVKPRLAKKVKRSLNMDNRIYIGEAATIRYMDGLGNITVRRIIPHELVQSGGKSYIYAYCYLRNENRYFNTRRILRVF